MDHTSKDVANAVYAALVDELPSINFEALMGAGGYNRSEGGLRTWTSAVLADCADDLSCAQLAAPLPQSYPAASLLKKKLKEYFSQTITLVTKRLVDAGHVVTP